MVLVSPGTCSSYHSYLLSFLLSFYLRVRHNTGILSLTYILYFVLDYDSWGYSLAFSEGAASSHFIGDLKYFAFQNVLDQPSGRIPVLLFAICESRVFGM